MRYPKKLEKNGTIGFVAPSFGCVIEPYHSAFQNAIKGFEKAGYQIRLGENVYASDGIGISSTPKNCARELTEHYCDTKSDVLISCGGGELMCEILDHVDLEAVRQAEPKWFMGYSDNTNFTFLLATICDVAAIYGPCAAAFGMEPWHASIQDAWDLITGEKQEFHSYPLWEKESLKDEEHPLEPYHVTEKSELCLFQKGEELAKDTKIKVEGRLIGGCMDCLVNLLGTKYDQVADFQERYEKDGLIWFLESCDLNVMSIRRAIWQMQHAGWFRHVKAFIIGRPLVFGQEMMGLDQYNAVYELLAEYDVPVIMDADLGHLAPMIPVICGGYAKVKVKDLQLEITYDQSR